MAALALAWAVCADLVPIYALYALWFADSGLSDADISWLLLLWSVVGLAAEVPTGVLADRFSRRWCLVAASVVQGLGYVIWVIAPDFAGFAVGFVLWGLSGALVSGAFEALIFDGLVAAGAESQYQRLLSRVTAAGLCAQLPVALSATMLFEAGGYPLVGWVSVGCCGVTALLALAFAEAPHGSSGGADADDPAADDSPALGYGATLRAGLAEVATERPVRALIAVVALLSAVDVLEEYFPLIAQDWRVPTAAVPLAILGIPVAGAIGAACAGHSDGRRIGPLTAMFGVAVAAFGVAAVVRIPAGLVGIALFYGLYQFVLVAVDSRLQHTIRGTARATVTSVASLAAELPIAAFTIGWAVGGLPLVLVGVALICVAMPRLLQR